MKKVLSLVLALVLVLGMIPTFAAGTGAQELKANGFISGNEKGDLLVDQALTREQLAALTAELAGDKELAAEFEQPAVYADAEDISSWAVPFVAYAQEMGWMTGIAKGTEKVFKPMDVVTGPELAATLMNALGYTVDTAAKYATVHADAAELGIKLPTGVLTRGDAFEAMWVAVSEVPMNGSEMTLGVYLGRLEPKTPVVTELVVGKVTADNLKAMTIEFNNELDKETVVAANFKLVRGTTTLTTAPTLLEDGKTVVLVVTTPANLTQSDTVKLTIEKVKDTTGQTVVAYESTFVVNDTKVPTIDSIVALNPKQLEVSFSEPVNFNHEIFTLFNDIKVDGTSIIARTEANNVTNKVIVTLTNALTEGTHSIEIKGVSDYAGFTAPTATLSFAVVKDDTAPMAESATVKTKNIVVVKFNEPVDVKGSFRIDGQDVVTTDWKDSRTVELTVPGSGLSIGAVVEVKVEYKGQKDIMGNEVKDWTSILTKVADDSSLPTVELTTVGVKNKLTLTFSKPMATAGTIELVNKDNSVVEIETVGVAGATFKANTSSKVLEVSFDALQGINPADYTLRIKDMKDATVRGNALATTNIAFKAIDTLDPTVAGTYVVTANADSTVNSDKDTITIFFSEAMEVASIENLSNYYMNGTPFSANASAVSAKASTDAKSVVITYKQAFTATLYDISVFAAKDIAGNSVKVGANVASKGTTTGLVVNSVEATDENTIKVTFNTVIKHVEPATFVLVNTATGNAVTNFVSATISSTSQAVVTFKTATAISTSASIYSVKVNSPASIANIYSQTLSAAATTAVEDKVAPKLKSVATAKDANNVVIDNAITFTFSEGMNPASAFNTGILVKSAGGTVLLPSINTAAGQSVITVVDDKVTITFGPSDLALIKGTGDNGNKTIKVSFPTGLGITDNASPANTLQPVADQEVVIKINN